jgi:hypothetical protein
MNQDDQDYAGLLEALRADENTDAGTGGISIDRAVQDGRRTVRRRRVVGGIAVVALITAASTSPLLLGAIRDRDKVEPVGPPNHPTTSQFSLWSRAFEAGAAGGFTPSTYTTGRTAQQIRLRPASAAVGNSTAGVTMLAPGIDPAHLSTEKNYVWSTDTRIGDIAGRPAYEVKQPAQADPFVIVAWQYADNGWGLAWVAGPAARVDRARQIAESVHRGGGQPVTVPFTVSRAAIGPDLQVISVSVPIGSSAGPTQYALGLAPDAMSSDPQLPGVDPTARITVGVIKGGSASASLGGAPPSSFTQFGLPDGYVASAGQSVTSSYSFNYTAVAASIRLSVGTTQPLR